LLESITTLCEKETQPTVAAALTAVAQALREGLPLSAAVSTQPACFDALFCVVVASAERTGQLQTALSAHAKYLTWVEDLRGKLINASLYPLMLLVAGFSVLLFLLVFVVPRFSGLLEGSSAQLPQASVALIAVGTFTGQHRLLTLLLGCMVLAAPALVWQHSGLKVALQRWLWTLPLLGEKLRLLALARLYRTLSMLLQAGVPLVNALQTARGCVAADLQDALQDATTAVSQGNRLSDALERFKLTTPVSLRMVRVGERTGALSAMLAQAAGFYDEELGRLSEIVTRLVNPLLMLLMGGVIGSVIVLMYLPIFQLVEQLQ
jgi:general secretion pathway protein F